MREPVNVGDEVTFDYELQIRGVFTVLKIDDSKVTLLSKKDGDERFHEYGLMSLYLYRSAAQIRTEKIDTLLA